METIFENAAEGNPIIDPESFCVLGVKVHAVQISDVIVRMQQWITRRAKCQFIAVTGMHGVMEARRDTEFMKILNSANLVVPDGMPLVWLGRCCGYRLRRRVYGPELLETFCANTARSDYRHYFYGGAPGVTEELTRKLIVRFPGLKIVGSHCPPFRALTDQEQRDIVRCIEDSRPDIVWVGLSTPKQEKWMYDFRSRLSVPILVGVGAAFDFHAGRVMQAPRWMREHGLEWLFRLVREPRRLWRRYLINGPKFVWLVVLESLRRRQFP